MEAGMNGPLTPIPSPIALPPCRERGATTHSGTCVPPSPGGGRGWERGARGVRGWAAALLLLALTACTPAPADVPEEPPAAPVRVEVLKWEPFQPTLALLGVVQPAGF